MPCTYNRSYIGEKFKLNSAIGKVLEAQFGCKREEIALYVRLMVFCRLIGYFV